MLATASREEHIVFLLYAAVQLGDSMFGADETCGSKFGAMAKPVHVTRCGPRTSVCADQAPCGAGGALEQSRMAGWPTSTATHFLVNEEMAEVKQPNDFVTAVQVCRPSVGCRPPGAMAARVKG